MSEIIDRINAALEGRYRIDSEVGAGGMATVYLAEDLKHKRKVALKVLKPELAAVVGAERFLAEIETTANLQHPHILALYDSGEADSFLFYVMPYVEGESLADRLEREQQLPVEEALRITKAVAGALDYAHRQGVVHRDIKPANILMQEGQPLVADFGIALAVSQAGDGRITETGLSLGTPHYMSPEQAAGERTLDKRSDVYALGCVLYEMLTGQPPFGGPNAQAVLGRILTGDPDPVTTHRRAVPPHVEAAVHKSLERLPADRFESAEALVDALDDPGFTTTMGTVTRGGVVAEKRWRRRFLAAAVVAFAGIAVGVTGWLRPSSGVAPEPVRFTLPLAFPSSDLRLAVSPDGRQLAMSNNNSGVARVRLLDDPVFRDLDIDRVSALTYSPDATALVVTRFSGELVTVPLDGGPTRTIGQAAAAPPAIWGSDGFIYHTLSNGSLARVPATGGAVDTLVVNTANGVVGQALLPGARGLLHLQFSAEGPTLNVLDLDSEEVSYLGPTTSVGATYEAGHLLYASDRFLMAQPFDPDALETTGPAVPVAEVPTGTMAFAYGGGTLAYVAGGQAGALVPRITDRAGRETELPNLGDGGFDFPEVSPDGDRIAMLVTGRGDGNDIWIYEMPSGPLSRLSLQGETNTTTWTRDGEDLLFIQAGDAYRTPSDGSRPPELVLDLDRDMSRVVLSPDEERIYFQVGAGDWDVGVATLGEEGSDSLLLAGDYWEGHPDISPDGRWLAYYSYESGQGSEVFIRPLWGEGRKHQVSRQGGLRPRWSSDGSELFFAGNDGGVWVARLADDGEDKDVLDVMKLFDMPGYNYDVFPGDSLFVAMQPRATDSDQPNDVTVVAHFDRILEELED